MQLTKYQRRALLTAKKFRDKPLPVVGSMLRSWKVYVVLSAILGGYSWWAWSIGVEASIASLGFLLGLLVRDITWFSLHARMWPVSVEITDWSKVGQIAQ